MWICHDDRMHRRRALALLGLLATALRVSGTTETYLAPVAIESEIVQDDTATLLPEPDPRALEGEKLAIIRISDSGLAQKALDDALLIIKALDSLPPHTASPPDTLSTWLFPNPSGPLASTLRIITKLRSQSWLPSFLSSRASRDEARVRQRLARLTNLLHRSIELGNTEAIYVLAHISVYPPVGMAVDAKRAFDLYSRHMDATGNGTSQGMLGFFYASGYAGIVPVDQAKASLYYTFGASSGDAASQMAMGYRYWAGIGVHQDCMSSLEWYERASGQGELTARALDTNLYISAMTNYLSGPPGGRTLPLKPTKLSDLSGGLYGHGASVASTGYNSLRAPITAANARAAGETWTDVLEYYTYHAERHEPDFALKLAKIYYHGSIYAGEAVGKVPRDYWRAGKYFRSVARKVWLRDSLINPLSGKKELPKEELVVASHAAVACAYLGKMYLRGEGVKADVRVARMWFMRGAELSEKESHNGLGIIYRDGLLDGKPDLKKAATYFALAAGQDLPEAQVNCGKIYYERKDYTTALPFFENAIRHGAPFEAYYYLADYNTQRARAGEPSACSVAVAFHKLVAERAGWALNEGGLILPGDSAPSSVASLVPPGTPEGPVSTWRALKEDGELNFRGMGVGVAGVGEEQMIRWSIESERGDETAQNNLAFVLDQGALTHLPSHTHTHSFGADKSSFRSSTKPVNDSNARLALQHYTRSAAQHDVDALVKVADYHFYGLGTRPDVERAVEYYSAAVDTQISAIAMWSLGWCYEYGVGVAKDYHLAKRHYDMALATNTEAYYPATIALIRLYFKSMYYTLMGGTDKNLLLLGDDGPDGEDAWDITRRLTGKSTSSQSQNPNQNSIKSDKSQAESGDEDPVKWGRQRGQEIERDRGEADMDYLPEDFFDGMMQRRPHRLDDENEDEDDEFLETMFLVLLCAAISGLVYLRGRWVARQAEEQRQGEQQPQPPANAMFPLGENFGIDR
ncbi:MMS2 protein [Ceratobasidium theobromae]|uniref:MMS2 protein n=1 Tax=Ceratobasidium theobromae TaxID=1582974 RepID=A0A5N5QCN9_9AGAM|nr:MMS2 protein [Ceratobasidium theobromae]